MRKKDKNCKSMKFRPIKKLSILLVVMISLLASCTTHDHRLVRLCLLDSLMEISPQAAYDSLKLFVCLL